MIDEIRVENLALIAEASLTPAAGLTAITGETGAGKTALLSALKLLVGERAEASMVREGEECLVVEGRVYAGDDDAVREVFATTLRAKPDEHHNKVGTERGMSQIGG